MNFRKNARTTPQRRALLARRVLEERRPVGVVTDAYGA